MNAILTGMSRSLSDGRFTILSAHSHIDQSIGDILTTPFGSRLMRLEYGSRLFELLDRPVNQSWKLEVYVAVTEALSKWEPRVKVKQVRVTSVSVGHVELEVDYVLIEDGRLYTSNQRISK
jgi:phage baseplate assembly protein W